MSDPIRPAGSPGAARLIARHLIGEEPTSDEVARWVHALEIAAAPLERARDQRFWMLATRSQLTLGLVDAGLALTDPHSPVRQRIGLMLAILEASPAHVTRFEARARSGVELVALAPRAALAVLRSAAGLALVRSWGVLWR